ncbi:GcrA cell cycle regulator [Devosia pacifica]|uniref:GcrA cell cycle regulator n=1 Tax=Devosia pacifica TaxID=1335967 RepID=A0A918SAC0_9HYPH|nr:GcrA family cell cycle regulator [Devosia pacifica]GHA31494.1 GcrA cell cycle regulator [Devosia pacifica]
MGWTDERVELLKRLWMEGLSASQIAAELGDGVTRNAVIGKVHRLKLSARAKPTSSTQRSRPTPRASAPRRSSGVSSSSGAGSTASMANRPTPRQSIMRTHTVGATALAATPEAEPETYRAPVQEMQVPEGQRLSLLELNEHTCKWPIGDPLSKDFYFCGQHSGEGQPYCEFHSRRAYHQMEKKKR